MSKVGTCKHGVSHVAYCWQCGTAQREMAGYQTQGPSIDPSQVFEPEQPASAAWHPSAQPAQANEPRALIRHFAAAMERKLAANDGVKGGWRDGTGWNPQTGLRQRLQEELGELLEALDDFTWRDGSEEAVLLEAADVANYAMMICDVVGALPPTDERGR